MEADSFPDLDDAADNYARAAAIDDQEAQPGRRTEQMLAEFEAQRAVYTAKHDNGEVGEQISQRI